MPDRYAYLKMGERDIDNAMPWDKIDPTEYNIWNNNSNFNQAITNSKNRISINPNFQLIEENAKWIDSRSVENVYSLNIDKFKVAQAEIEEKAKKYKPIVNYNNSLNFTSLPNEMEAMSKDISLKEKRDSWHDALSKDIYVEEAINVLDDLQPRSMSTKNIPVKMKKDKLAKS